VTAAPTSGSALSKGVDACDKRGHDEWMYVMLYAVSAKLVPDRAPEFHARLADGSIAAQRPDGAEIVAAMQRARVAVDGIVRWTETCYARRRSSTSAPPCLTAISPGLRQRSSTSLWPSTAHR
jgi:hypothetical protein